MSTNIQAISDASFETEVMSSATPVLVDFWAPWCAPCRALAPILEELSTIYKDKVKFVKMDIDQNPDTPVKYGVRGIPTLILFKDGQVQGTQVGLIGKAELGKFIESNS